MKTIDPQYNYCEAYLTFRCQLACPYCVNNANGKIKRDRSEIRGPEWVKLLDTIDFGSMPLTFGGGEPTLHPDFLFILDRLRPGIRVDLLTNLTFDVDEFIASTSPARFSVPNGVGYKSIRISYHPARMEPNELVFKASRLQNHGFSVGIFAISHPANTASNIRMAELARQNSLYFFIKDYLGEYNGRMIGCYRYPDALDNINKECQCRTKELLIDPSGYIFRCHADLYLERASVGSIWDTELPGHIYRPCSFCGTCNPCDVKEKTNRFLQAGNSSVEIVTNTKGVEV